MMLKSFLRLLQFAWHFLAARPATALLNGLLLSLGLASITFLILVHHQLGQAFERDLKGIDLVVGAKGSPLQLILSGVFHLDVPNGNVPLAAVESLRAHPQVAQVIPLSLGDSFEGFRIVGTTRDYPQHYQASLASGQWWSEPGAAAQVPPPLLPPLPPQAAPQVPPQVQAPASTVSPAGLPAVLGARVAAASGLKVGDRFVGSHGLGGGGERHNHAPFVVSGVLQANGTVLDRLVLTSTESIWQMHEKAQASDAEDLKALQAERELTLALVRYKTPLAAVTLPRWVNSSTEMQAAAPAIEITRLLRMLGLGLDVLRALAVALLLTAALSLLIALWNAVRERRADIALLRMLGASGGKVAALLLCEAVWLALAAAVVGLLAGQGLLALAAFWLKLDNSVLIQVWQWPSTLAAVPVLAVGLALLAALLPVWQAYRVSVFELLRN